MSKETRLSADRVLRESHLRRTLTWYNQRLDKSEEKIMNLMRSTDSQDPDTSLIGQAMCERQCIIDNCKELHKKIYG
jgi:hypothetical protein